MPSPPQKKGFQMVLDKHSFNITNTYTGEEMNDWIGQQLLLRENKVEETEIFRYPSRSDESQLWEKIL